jgi:hypothetical protein
MRPQIKSRRNKHKWPDQSRWRDELKSRIHDDKEAIAACKTLKNAGCLEANLLGFLYAYTFTPTTVFPEHSRKRDDVFGRLKTIAKRLDTAADEMQGMLDTEWWCEPTFGRFLKRLKLDFQLTSPTGMVVSGQCSPDFAFQLPALLRANSIALQMLRKDLQPHLSARKVGNAIYLAEFATYIKVLTGGSIPWTAIAALVRTARPDTFDENAVSPSLLQKKFKSFVSRNPDLYREIELDTGKYLADCVSSGLGPVPTLAAWTLARKRGRSQPPSSKVE